MAVRSNIVDISMLGPAARCASVRVGSLSQKPGGHDVPVRGCRSPSAETSGGSATRPDPGAAARRCRRRGSATTRATRRRPSRHTPSCWREAF